MNRSLSVKEVVALFEKFMSGLANDEIEKIVGMPTLSNRQDKIVALASVLMNNQYVSESSFEIRCQRQANAVLEWVKQQVDRSAYQDCLSDVRKNLGIE